MSPVKCPICGVKYHDEAKRKFRLLGDLLIYTAIVVSIIGFFPQLKYLKIAGIIFGCLGILIFVYDEFLVIRNGVLVETTLGNQNKDLRLILIGAVILIIGILIQVYYAL